MSTSAQTRRGQRRSREKAASGDVRAGEFGRERFRFRLRREQRRLETLNIDPYVESVTWSRTNAVRTGELTFRRPLTGMEANAIARGDRVQCDIDLASGRWEPLWYMTVGEPDHQIATGVMTVSLKAGLKAAETSKAAFKFKDKDARQITRAVAARFDIPTGPLPKANHTIDKIVRRSCSPIDMITAAWAAERRVTGRRFDVDISRGRIDVTELREPTRTLLVGDAVMDAAVKHSLSRMVSAVIVTSTRKQNGRKKKLRVRVIDKDRVRRYGYIVRTINEPGLKTEAACRKHGNEYLARVGKPRDGVTFRHPGLPFLDRGDAMRLTIDDADIRGLMCFVKRTTHELSAGSYTTDVTVGITDPWVDARKERAKKKREIAAKARKRAGADDRSPSPRPAKADRRSR